MEIIERLLAQLAKEAWWVGQLQPSENGIYTVSICQTGQPWFRLETPYWFAKQTVGLVAASDFSASRITHYRIALIDYRYSKPRLHTRLLQRGVSPPVDSVAALFEFLPIMAICYATRCACCGRKPRELYVCVSCSFSLYCDEVCRKAHFNVHRSMCRAVAILR